MNRHRRLLEEGWLTQADAARVLGMSPAAVHKAITTGRLQAHHHPSWSSPVIHVEELKRFGVSRGLSPEIMAINIHRLGQQSGWGPVIIGGLIGLLLLGTVWWISRTR